MVIGGIRGWFGESYRHSLASRGYFSKKSGFVDVSETRLGRMSGYRAPEPAEVKKSEFTAEGQKIVQDLLMADKAFEKGERPALPEWKTKGMFEIVPEKEEEEYVPSWDEQDDQDRPGLDEIYAFERAKEQKEKRRIEKIKGEFSKSGIELEEDW